MISSIINSSVSGLRAAELRMGTAASNITNANSTSTTHADGSKTAAYQPKHVEQTSLGSGGVSARQVATQPASLAVFAPDAAGADNQGNVDVPNISLSAEAVEMKMADVAYRASLKTIDVADEMLGEILDAKT